MIFRYKSLDKEIIKENAKDIYYSTYNMTLENLNFYYENFTNEEFLKWNDEYINKELDICESYFNEEICLTTLAKHIYKFSYLVEVFTNNKETYIRIIKYLKRLYSKYGYFISYLYKDPFGRDFDWGPSVFVKFLWIYLRTNNKGSSDRSKKYFESVYYFYPNYQYCGIIHHLNLCGFYDVLNSLFIDLIIPIFENYQKQEYFLDLKIEYIENKKGLKQYGLYKLLKDYILEFDIDAPKRLKEILEIE